jgi:polysaccharide export outer membrane protein
MRPSSPIVFTGLLILLILSLSARAETGGMKYKPYQINTGDDLAISVWHEENLARQMLVMPDGKVSFPLVGSVMAAGKTIDEVQQLFTNKLSAYIPDPVVTIVINKLDGNKIYVIGKVARPGEFIANRYIDVVQALSIAGGMTAYAAANKIKILRRENGQLTAIPFKYGDIEKGKNLQQNIILQSGDVVLVP